MQAVELNPEICIIVVDKDNLPTRGRGKADVVDVAEGSSPFLRYGK